MTLPRVTIITPSFNQAQFLEQTLQSVLSQGYPNLEYLVVDGGSTDGSVEIIQRHADSLVWWVSEPDHGQAEAVNKGLARASGEIIGWLNSDDLYESGAIAAAVKAFADHPECALVHGDVRAVDAEGCTTNLLSYGNWGLDGLMCFQIMGQPSVFIRRSAVEQGGTLDLSYHYLLDHEWWLRLAQFGGVAYVPQTWSAARFHAAAKNVAHASEFGAEAYRIVEWMQTQPNLQARFARLKRKIWAGAHRINARYLLDGDQPRAALYAYSRSFWADPATALAEFPRMVYALAASLGFGAGLRAFYLNWRQKRMDRHG